MEARRGGAGRGRVPGRGDGGGGDGGRHGRGGGGGDAEEAGGVHGGHDRADGSRRRCGGHVNRCAVNPTPGGGRYTSVPMEEVAPGIVDGALRVAERHLGLFVVLDAATSDAVYHEPGA